MPFFLESNREEDLEGDIATRVEDAATSCGVVHVGVFQSAKMALIGCVQQILSNNVNLT